MTIKRRYAIGLIVAPLVCLLDATAAHAQQERVFVSGKGSDGNPCNLANPCRTFQKAHDTAASGGEIDVLDPAGYGPLTITKAISIEGRGYADISVPSGGTGISINAPTAAINLSGLHIDGHGVGLQGILFANGGSLVVENCVVRNMNGFGLDFPSSAAVLQTLSVSNSYFTENSASGAHGMRIVAFGSGPVKASIDHVGFYGSNIGLDVIGTFGTGALDVAVRDSTAANSSSAGVGFIVQSATGHSPTSLVLTRATASGNTVGVSAAGTNATLRLTQSTVTGNFNGYQITNGGVIVSYGDNVIDGNGPNFGTLTSGSKQ